MTIFYYILVAMLSALMLGAAVVIVFKKGEKELLAQYTPTGERGEDK
jgi:hypothetical protein